MSIDSSFLTRRLLARGELDDGLKRLLDHVLASVGLVVLSPVLAMIAVLVRTTSTGPTLYRGIRTGRGGRPFAIYKFRTMVVNAERIGGPSTGKNDPRVTKIGRVLRRYKLDELPQLVNVLKGEMSIVGPRPEVPEYTCEYSEEEKEILSVRPGITDFASLELIRLDEILGSEDPDLVYETTVRPVKNALRLKYVRTRSIGLDCVLIARTVMRLCGIGSSGLGPANSRPCSRY